MIKKYQQPGHEGVTNAVDKLQQEVGLPHNSPVSQHGAMFWQDAGLSHMSLAVPLLW